MRRRRHRAVGVFLMVGTSGTGKTETALTLAELLYGGEQNMTVINMSEYKEEHKVSLLMGSPPGYVGYGGGGVLTEAVRRRSYSVVLLDEMEKAHPGVQDVFFSVFDKGKPIASRRRVRDAYRATFEFDHALVATIASRCTESSSGTRNVADILSRTLLPELSAEVLGRLAAGDAINSIAVGIDPSGSFTYKLD